MIIETEKEYNLALDLVYQYMNEESITIDDEDLLEIVSKAIEKYEDIYYPIDKPSVKKLEQFRKENGE